MWTNSRTSNRTNTRNSRRTKKATKAKTKLKISSLKLHEEFLNKIKIEEKNINEQIFREYFNYQFPSFKTETIEIKVT